MASPDTFDHATWAARAKALKIETGLFIDGKYQPSLHVGDKLHFNEKGYEIWTSIMRQSIAEIK